MEVLLIFQSGPGALVCLTSPHLQDRRLTNNLVGQESIGEDNLANAPRMLVSLSLWPFMRIGGMSAEQYRALIAGAVAELRDPRMKLYYKVLVFLRLCVSSG